MTKNNILIISIAVCVFAAIGFFAFSQANAAKSVGAMQAMFGIRAIVMNQTDFDDKANYGKACGISAKEIHTRFVDIFRKNGLPVIPNADQWDKRHNIAALYFTVTLSTNQDSNMECFTMIMANAKNRATLAVPPVPNPRDVQILYWDSARKIFSIQPLHEQKVFETIDMMANNFVAQFKEANKE